MVDTAKIRVKLGSLEIDFEGSSDYLVNNLADFCERIVALRGITSPADVDSAAAIVEPIVEKKAREGLQGLSMNAIAKKIGQSKGIDLLKAAAASLHLVHGREIFLSKDIMDEAKRATSFFKASTHTKRRYYI